MTVCKYLDPHCPCQDGDLCHYEGINPWPVSAVTALAMVAAEREACAMIAGAIAKSEDVHAEAARDKEVQGDLEAGIYASWHDGASLTAAKIRDAIRERSEKAPE